MVKHELPPQTVAVAQLRRIGNASPVSDGSDAAAVGRLTQLWQFLKLRPWFMLVAILPSVLGTLYFGFVASDIYVSEARFVVRSATQPQGTNQLGSFLQTVGVVRSQDDTFSVHDYILSRDIVTKLEDNQDLRAILSRPEGDFVRRFPPPFGRDTFEQLFKSYNTFVHVAYNGSTGISTLTVEAFRPQDAHLLATTILSYSEDLINRMNERVQTDSVAFARREVRTNEERVVDAQEALTQFRIRTNLLDPEINAGAVLELVAQLSIELATTQALLAETQTAAPGSPQIMPLRNHVAALQAQIADERAKVIGDNNSIALQLSEYERLLLEQEFATKALASATASLELVRLEANRQQLYLGEIVTPNTPDYPIYPQRLRSIFVVIASVFMIYGIAWLVSASVREHIGR